MCNSTSKNFVRRGTKERLIELTFVGNPSGTDALTCVDHFGWCTTRVHESFDYEDFDDTEVVVIQLDGHDPDTDSKHIIDVLQKVHHGVRVYTLEDSVFTEK